MKALYLLLDIAIFAAPFALSFDKKVAFYKRWPELSFSIAVVGIAYLVWDVVVTRMGHWSFNPGYSGLFKIAGLPDGELLFFIVVPYACLFVYEVVGGYMPLKQIRAGRSVVYLGLSASAAFAVLAIAYRGQGYTFAAMLSMAALFALVTLADREMWLESHTWLFYLLSYIPFLIANGVLTAIPIVEYNSQEIWNIRVYTIPLEDFFYNFAMLGFFLLVFRAAKRHRRRRRENRHGE